MSEQRANWPLAIGLTSLGAVLLVLVSDVLADDHRLVRGGLTVLVFVAQQLVYVGVQSAAKRERGGAT